VTGRVRVLLAILVAGVGAAGAGLFAQDLFGRRSPSSSFDNVEYNGQVTFVRLRYATDISGYGRRRDPGWFHDYPTADIHMMKILKELTIANPRVDGSNILAMDDPELCNYPIAYLSEPGFWLPSDAEAAGLRNYLLKGGFIIFDDFRGYDWNNLEEQMRRVVPELRFVQIDSSNPIFHSFFEIDDLQFLTSYGPGMPTYWAMFENNDPSKRVLAIANRDNDLGEYWEFSDTGMDPVDFSNEAYKFGTNYFVYGLTH
jgi:uncharacterized protein DUF4159